MSKIDSAARLGAYIATSFGDERVRAYLPRPLPPTPALRLEPLLSRIEDANRALGRLDGVTSIDGWYSPSSIAAMMPRFGDN